MFKIFITSKAKREFRDIPKEFVPRIVKAIDSLKSTYYPDTYDVKKLKGLENTYRIRIGDWRIVYFVDFEKKEIFVGSLLPRKKVYKKK